MQKDGEKESKAKEKETEQVVALKHAVPEHKADRKIVLEATDMQKVDEFNHATPEHIANYDNVLEAARMLKDFEKKRKVKEQKKEKVVV